MMLGNRIRKTVLTISTLLFLMQASYSQDRVLSPDEMSRVIPASIMKGYSQVGQPVNRQIKVGTLRYTLSERKFSSGEKKIKILLFDYGEAGIMYSQATKKFGTMSEVSTDSLYLSALKLENGLGWETGNIRASTTQINVGINNRFYLSIEGEYVHREELKEVLEYIDTSNFPK